MAHSMREFQHSIQQMVSQQIETRIGNIIPVLSQHFLPPSSSQTNNNQNTRSTPPTQPQQSAPPNTDLLEAQLLMSFPHTASSVRTTAITTTTSATTTTNKGNHNVRYYLEDNKKLYEHFYPLPTHPITPIHVHKLSEYLVGHPDKGTVQFITDGLTHGFDYWGTYSIRGN